MGGAVGVRAGGRAAAPGAVLLLWRVLPLGEARHGCASLFSPEAWQWLFFAVFQVGISMRSYQRPAVNWFLTMV